MYIRPDGDEAAIALTSIQVVAGVWSRIAEFPVRLLSYLSPDNLARSNNTSPVGRTPTRTQRAFIVVSIVMFAILALGPLLWLVLGTALDSVSPGATTAVQNNLDRVLPPNVVDSFYRWAPLIMHIMPGLIVGTLLIALIGSVILNLAFGATITNLGGKISYSDANNKDFLPTNFRIGSFYKMELDARNTLSFALDFN